MTDSTAHPLPTDADVQWFGASRRLVGGQPDSRYGWLDTPDGPCIVKAMSPELVAYNHTLLQHERRMLSRLSQVGAPSPGLVEVGRDDWLVTRFAGLTLQRLQHRGGLQGLVPGERLPFEERLAAWVHLLRRLQPLADSGVLAIDLYEANVVLPLTQGTEGQLRLHEAGLIDHAHTLEAGMNLRRPVWLQYDMARIAPELRAALQQDQAQLAKVFREADADLPGYSRLPGPRDAHNRRVWAEYDAPQALQRLLDAGNLSRDAAMQFAAAMAIAKLLGDAAPGVQRPALAQVLRRMSQAEPARRFPTLRDAAEALSAVLPALPMVSRHVHAPLQASDLAMPDDAQPGDPPPDDVQGGFDGVTPSTPHADAVGASAFPERALSPRQYTLVPLSLAGVPARWIYAAVALGAIVGTAWPW